MHCSRLLSGAARLANDNLFVMGVVGATGLGIGHAYGSHFPTAQMAFGILAIAEFCLLKLVLPRFGENCGYWNESRGYDVPSWNERMSRSRNPLVRLLGVLGKSREPKEVREAYKQIWDSRLSGQAASVYRQADIRKQIRSLEETYGETSLVDERNFLERRIVELSRKLSGPDSPVEKQARASLEAELGKWEQELRSIRERIGDDEEREAQREAAALEVARARSEDKERKALQKDLDQATALDPEPLSSQELRKIFKETTTDLELIRKLLDNDQKKRAEGVFALRDIKNNPYMRLFNMLYEATPESEREALCFRFIQQLAERKATAEHSIPLANM